MIRKTALLTGIAGAMLMAVPALAQAVPAQEPMAPAAQTPPAAAAPAASGTLQLQPGANVKGSDGSVLGTLEGVQNNAAGEQELTVRGADGQVRGVPLGGLSQQGADVAVAWSAAEFQAAPVVAAGASTEMPAATPPAAPTTPPSDPMTSPVGEAPAPTEPQS